MYKAEAPLYALNQNWYFTRRIDAGSWAAEQLSASSRDRKSIRENEVRGECGKRSVLWWEEKRLHPGWNLKRPGKSLKS